MMPFKSLRCGTPVEVEDQSFDGQPLNLGVEPTAQIAAAQAARYADKNSGNAPDLQVLPLVVTSYSSRRAASWR